MKNILGLDLGTTSVGWAVVKEAENAEETSSIVNMGVRLTPLSTDEQTHFNTMAGETVNQKRSRQTGARRNLQRYKLRRTDLVDILKEYGIISDDTILYETGNETTFETYRLRAKAVTEEISLNDFARVLIMLNKKRGYRSSRKGDAQEGGMAISSLDVSKRLMDEHITPGEMAYEILRSGKRKLPEFYKSDLLNEFEMIWDYQSQYYKELTSELRDLTRGKNSSQTETILSKALNVVGKSRKNKDKIWQRLDNYRLRSAAVHSCITLEEFVVVIQEINGEISKASGYLNEICEHSKSLFLNNQTIGQYLMMLLDKDHNKSLKNMVFYRNDHIAEYDAIWDNQAKYHKELTPELKEKIRNNIIYYQRPLKSKKGLVSICEFEQKEIEVEKNGRIVRKTIGNRVIPRSSPLFQEFKIWQTLNNIVVSLKGVNKKSPNNPCLDIGEDELYINGSRNLTTEEKALLANELQVKAKLKSSEVISLLFGAAKKIELNYKELGGDNTMSQLYQAYSKMLDMSGHMPLNFNESASQIKKQAHEEFSALGWNEEILDFDGAQPLDSQCSYRLWHLLYSFVEDNLNGDISHLIEKISELTGIDKEYCGALAELVFVDDYGSLSAKAIKKILPHLKDGLQYDEACMEAGYKHSKSSLTKDEIENKELRQYLDILPKNSLRNPIVEKILNQMTNVVNALVDEYGTFDEIRVELARELKKSANERKELNDSMQSLTGENERIRQLLISDFNISRPSKNDIVRYKLYDELKPLGYHTPYSNKYIPKEQLFSKQIDIEHIIPQARILDDSISNKTLEYRDVNIEKGNSTAYDYVLSKYGEDGLQKYIDRCKLCFDKKKTKLRKLLMSETEIPKDFVDRDIRNTQYISKKALSMLSAITRRVVATSGTITAKLREDWQLIDIMKEINWNKYDAIGMTEYHTNREGKQIGQINGWSKRNDHRHHAIDALTVAFTKDAFIQYFNNKNASDKPNSNEYAIRRKYVKDGKILPPMPLDRFRADARKQIESILISVKAKNKVVTQNVNKVRVGSCIKEKVQLTPRGQLHNETIYGSHYEYECTEEKVGSKFSEEKILTVCNGAYRRALLARLREYEGDAKKAFIGRNALNKKPIWLNESHTSAVPEKVKTVQLVMRHTVRKAITKDLTISKVVDAKIRKLLEERVKEYGTAKDAFSNLEQNPIWLNKEKGIRIKRVTIYDNSEKPALHEKRGQNGVVLKEHLPVDFVNTSGNHHIAIYRKPITDNHGVQRFDENGNAMTELTEVVVTFYEAVTRAIHGLPVVDKEYKQSEGWKFLYSMKQNEYFVFPDDATGFNPFEVDLLDVRNASLISPNLFRVQKISSKYYNFRHHLDTTVEDIEQLRNVTWKRIRSLADMDKIVKVRINHIGQIVEVGEY